MADSRPKRRPAVSPEIRENQLIELAVDLAEKRLSDGTASTPLITHYLKLASAREALEREKIQYETELLRSRAAQIKSESEREEIALRAIEAMRSYQPERDNDDRPYVN